MAYRYFDPFKALLELQRSLDSTRSSNWFDRGTSGSGTYPPVNVFSKGDELAVIAELPGVKKSDIDIKVKKNQLRISGKKEISYAEDTSVHRRERSSGQFDRTLTLPIEIDPDGIQANYKNGILAILLPRAESEKSRTISIA